MHVMQIWKTIITEDDIFRMGGEYISFDFDLKF